MNLPGHRGFDADHSNGAGMIVQQGNPSHNSGGRSRATPPKPTFCRAVVRRIQALKWRRPVKKTSDAQFLDKRRRFVRTWNLVGTALLAALAALTAWLFTASPSLVNPPQVAAEIARGALPQSTLELMAGLLPALALGFTSAGWPWPPGRWRPPGPHPWPGAPFSPPVRRCCGPAPLAQGGCCPPCPYGCWPRPGWPPP